MPTDAMTEIKTLIQRVLALRALTATGEEC